MTWLYVPSMHSTYAVDTEDSSLPSDFSTVTYEPFVTLSGKATQRPLSSRIWKRRPWIVLLSGMTLPPLMAQRGVDEWISSLPVCRASRSRRQAASGVLKMTATFGRKRQTSSVMWDRDLSSWRTCQESLVNTGLNTSSLTLPKWGSMRSGVCSEQPISVPRIDGTGSGSWPTPTTKDTSLVHTPMDPNGTHGMELRRKAALWGTPAARDDQKSPEAHMAMKARMGGGRKQPTSLTVQVKMWPTPRASMNENRTTRHAPSHGKTHGRTLAGEALGLPDLTTRTDGGGTSLKVDLNPRFVAALMGLPWDWLTPSTSEAMASYHKWQQRHSKYSLAA